MSYGEYKRSSVFSTADLTTWYFKYVVLPNNLYRQAWNSDYAYWEERGRNIRLFTDWSERWRMPSSGIWRRVDLVRTDVSEERVATIFRVGKIREREKCYTFANRTTVLNSTYTFVLNVGFYKTHTASHPRIRHFSWPPLWNLQILGELRDVCGSLLGDFVQGEWQWW
jgi:hypothetical protein